MTTTIIFPGAVISTPWRNDRSTVTVSDHDYENFVRLRPALIVAAM